MANTKQQKPPAIPYRLVIVFFILAVLNACTGYFYYKNQQRTITMEKQQELAAIADLKVKQLSSWRRERLGDAQLIFANTVMAAEVQKFLRAESAPGSRENIRAWLTAWYSYQGYVQVFLLDRDGRLRMSIPDSNEQLGPVATGCAVEAMRTGKVQFSDLHRGDKGDVHLDVLSPIIEHTGLEPRTVGTILLRIDPHTFLYPLINEWPTPSATAENLLIRREGSEVVFLNELRYRKNTALLLKYPVADQRLPAAMAARGYEGAVEGIDYRGVPVLATIQKVPDTSWYLIAKVDAEEVYAPARRQLTYVVVVMVLLMLSAAGILAAFWRREQLQTLQKQHAAELERLALMEHYAYMSRYANDIIILLDEQFNIVEINERAEVAYGYTRQELLNKNMRELRAPEQRAFFESDFQRITEKGSGLFETVNQRKDGTTFPVEVSARMIEIAGEKFYQGIARDITERMQAERKIREECDRAQQYLDVAAVIFVALDTSQRVTMINKKGIELLGYAEGDIIGENWFDVFIPERMREETKSAFTRLMAGETRAAEYFENPVVTRSGAERIIAWHNTVLRDSSGAITGTLSSGDDITERKQTEQALRASEERFKRMAENISEGLTMVGPDGAIFINDRTCEITGYPREELRTIKTSEVATPEYRPLIMETERKFLESGTLPEALEFEIIRKDGSRRFVSNRYSASWGDGKIISRYIITADITERRKADEEQERLRQQLYQSQKMEAIGHLAGGIAHDFNNILSAIIGYANLTEDKMADDDPLRKNIQQILFSSERAANLVRSLLAFSRKQLINPRPVGLDEIVLETEKMLRRTIGEDIELRSSLSGKDTVILADAGQIDQILINLATNARDAMPGGGTLSLSTGTAEIGDEYIAAHGFGVKGRYGLLTVTDTGTGMDEKTRSQIFEPFFTTKEVGKGTGLGLSTAYGIVKQHNGYINCYSEQGRGTTFKIYLPLIETTAEQKEAPEQAAPLIGGTETILMAEDDRTIRDLNRSILEKFGYRVIEAEDGEDALQKFKEHQKEVQLLLLDVVMPKKNGREVFETIQNLRPGIKALFMSGYTADIIHSKGYVEEGFTLITKPVSMSALLKAVRKVLDK